jgi:hypothetical protein
VLNGAKAANITHTQVVANNQNKIGWSIILAKGCVYMDSTNTKEPANWKTIKRSTQQSITSKLSSTIDSVNALKPHYLGRLVA